MSDNQYIVPSCYYDEINVLDNEIVKLIAKGDHRGFKKKYAEMISIIKKNGVPMEVKTLQESDLIVPPADLSFDEAQKIFVGEGLIPG
jgi:hypothetical protein